MGKQKATTALPQSSLINGRRESAIAAEFLRNKGRRIFIMMAPFPFMVIGRIKGVESDHLYVQIETTHISEIEGRITCIHIDSIQVFYIEKPGFPRIPKIQDQNPDGNMEE